MPAARGGLNPVRGGRFAQPKRMHDGDGVVASQAAGRRGARCREYDARYEVVDSGARWAQGYHCDLDNSSKTLQKKIRDNQLAQYNYILVVGKDEVENKTVNVRTRDNQVAASRSPPGRLPLAACRAAVLHVP